MNIAILYIKLSYLNKKKIKYTQNHWYNSSPTNVGTRRTNGNEIKLKVEHVTRQLSPLQLIFTSKRKLLKHVLEYLFLLCHLSHQSIFYLQMHLQAITQACWLKLELSTFIINKWEKEKQMCNLEKQMNRNSCHKKHVFNVSTCSPSTFLTFCYISFFPTSLQLLPWKMKRKESTLHATNPVRRKELPLGEGSKQGKAAPSYFGSLVTPYNIKFSNLFYLQIVIFHVYLHVTIVTLEDTKITVSTMIGLKVSWFLFSPTFYWRIFKEVVLVSHSK